MLPFSSSSLFHCYVLDTYSIFPISLFFLSTAGLGIYLFNFVSFHNSRGFLIGDICTLSDVRVRALCCELSGALGSALSSSSVSQVASDMPECEWRGTRHTPPLQMNWDTRSLHFWHKEHSECLPKPGVSTPHSCHDITFDLWAVRGQHCGDLKVISVCFAICFV